MLQERSSPIEGTPKSASPRDDVTLPNFPPIPLRRETYQNWCGTVTVEDVWTCEPRSTGEAVAIANWARAHNFRLRAGGRKHTFSPLVLTDGGESRPVLLVDTTRHLTWMHIAATRPAAARVGAGATIDALLTFLESHGYGLSSTTGAGDLAVGGVLAVGAHGTGIPLAAQPSRAGHMFGSLSNLVLSLTAVVWDEPSNQYVARTFERSDEDCAAFLVHLGRAFITEVTLRVGANLHLRCESDVTIPAGRVFAPPGTRSQDTAAALAERCGRLEMIWFPYTDHTWVKTWTVQTTRPSCSRPVTTPYNYPFADNLPKPICDLISRATTGAPECAPELCKLQYLNVVQGLGVSLSADISGASKNVLLYTRPTTLRYTVTGYAVSTSRANLQRVIHEFMAFVQQRLRHEQERGRYPLNGPMEIRVTGLDITEEVGPAACAPTLSPIAPDPAHPAWDVAVWFNLLSFRGTPYAGDFFRDVEGFTFANYRAPYAMARVEWSKGWAQTRSGPWTSQAALASTVPSTFGDSWGRAKATLNKHDPHRLFTNDFLDRLL
jgi:FAD/FMN-containing dehydrogenase